MPTRKTTKKTTRRTATKTTRKPVKKTAKKVVRKRKPKYTFPKKFVPYYERKEIKISSKVYNALVSAPSSDSAGYPLVYLLGEDNKKIIREMVQLYRKGDSFQGGCGQMPDIFGDAITEGYIVLAKQNLMPVGICRTRESFEGYDGGGYWDDAASGSAIIQMGLILSVAKHIIVAEAFVPRYPKEWKKGNRNSDNYWCGTNRQLTVLLTDK